MRAAEPAPGLLGWAWSPGRRPGGATRPSGAELLQNCHVLFFGCRSSASKRQKGMLRPP